MTVETDHSVENALCQTQIILVPSDIIRGDPCQRPPCIVIIIPIQPKRGIDSPRLRKQVRQWRQGPQGIVRRLRHAARTRDFLHAWVGIHPRGDGVCVIENIDCGCAHGDVQGSQVGNHRHAIGAVPPAARVPDTIGAVVEGLEGVEG